MRPSEIPVPNSSQASMSLGSRLCTQCGLCCNGALHHHAVLEPSETSFAERLGLDVTAGDRPRFALPCSKLCACSCSIYENRPEVCGRYKCQLLQELEGGMTDLGTAVSKVQHAKGLIKEIERQLPPGTTLPEARLQYLGTNDQDQPGPNFMPLKLALTILCLYIDTHFKNDREVKFLSVEPMRSSGDSLVMK